MSFLFPRTVSVRRPTSNSGVGFQAAYSGTTRESEDEVFKDLPASIQLRREGSANKTGLPGDATSPFWDVFLHRRSIKAGEVQSKDVFEDDLGRRFQVAADDYEALNPRFRCMKLES